VLVKDTTKTGQETSIDFKLYPLALAELQHVPQDQRVGPVIKDGRTGQPFKERRFQKNWRAVARAAGIPDDIMNRDSRAGGVTEGSDAGADLEHLRQYASHSSVTTTARYSRKTLTKTRAVARLLVAHRQVTDGQNNG
jgi:integrase